MRSVPVSVVSVALEVLVNSRHLRKRVVALRDRAIKLDQYGISYWEYRELVCFCKQYQYKRMKARELLCVSSPDMSGMPRGNAVGHPTESAAIKRIIYLEDVELIESAAREVDGGSWYKSLIESCCYGKPYKALNPHDMPTSHRQSFFTARKKFFWILHRKKMELRGT